MALGSLSLLVTTAVTSLTIISAPVTSMTMGSAAPAPQVIAWASFLGEDGPINSSSQWSSGEAWTPLVGNWAQVDGAAVTTRSSANARAVAAVPDAGNSARVIARVLSIDGSAVHSGGVVAAASITGTRVALAAMITPDGSLEIRRISGGGAASTLIATSGVVVMISPAIEISLQIIDGLAIATAKNLSAEEPVLILEATLTPAQVSEIATNTAYGLFALSTTNLEFTAVRVEWPA
jgi:hypothetical protein